MAAAARKPSWQRAFHGKRARGIPRMLGDGRRVGLMHAHKGGVPVLIDESSWRTINGVYVNTKWGWAYVLFRRRMK